MDQQPSLSKSLLSSCSPFFGEIAVGLGLDPISRVKLSPSKVGAYLLSQLTEQNSSSALIVARSGGVSLVMNPDGRLELGSRDMIVLMIRNQELQISCFDSDGKRIETFSHLVAGLNQLEGHAFRTGCNFSESPLTNPAFQLQLMPRGGDAKYWTVNAATDSEHDLRLILGMLLWRLKIREFSPLQAPLSEGMFSDSFWYQIKLGKFNVALGFADVKRVTPDTPYSLVGNYICLEIVSPRVEPGLREVKTLTHAREVRDCIASEKLLQHPYPRLCIQFKRTEIHQLQNFLGRLRSLP